MSELVRKYKKAVVAGAGLAVIVGATLLDVDAQDLIVSGTALATLLGVERATNEA